MTKQEVVTLRDRLKAGKGFALICTLANGQDLIDETNMAGFVYWDDTNGIVYDFRLSSMLNDTNINSTRHLDVLAVPYEEITSMKVVGFPIDKFDDFFNSLGTMPDNMKEYLKGKYQRMFDPNLTSLGPDNRNRILGAVVDQSPYDYYNGKWHRPFKELHEVDAYNKSIEKTQKDYNLKRNDKEPLDLIKKDVTDEGIVK